MKFIFILLAIPITLLCIVYFIDTSYTIRARYFLNNLIKQGVHIKKVNVPEEYSRADKNKNGIADPLDIVSEARKEVERETPYKSAYYVGGYPPDSEGVCTDVIWRAFKGMGVDLKELVDKDIKENAKPYYRVNNKPDPNIDFRRVPNLDVFLQRYTESLTTELKPGDIENLKQWQPGDIVVILEPFEHIGIISDKRTKDGVPYLIHNSRPHASEKAHFNLWVCKIKGHYRWKYK